jgi:sialidase-1
MSQGVAFALTLALVCSAAPSVAAEDVVWTQTYDMTRHPGLSGWLGDNTSDEVKEGVLRIVDGSTVAGSGHCFQVDWEASPAREAVVEARVKVISCVGEAGVCLWVSNGVNEDGLTLYPDRVELAFAKLKYDLDTTADFHVYRLTIQRHDLKLSVDGKLALDATGKFTHEAYQGRNELSFGSASSAATGESLWDYVRFRSPFRVQVGRRPPGLRTTTIFREPDTYAVFPSLYLEPRTERLYTSFRAGGPRSHINAAGSGTVSMVSDDGGKTWQRGEAAPSTPFTGPHGRQVRVWCKWWQEHPADQRAALEQQGYEVHDVREGVVAICAGAVCSRSADGGKTWQDQEIRMPSMAVLASGMNSRQLPDGTILFPVYGKAKAGQNDSSWVLRSADYGETWQLIPVGSRPQSHLNEPEIVQTASGRLLMAMRTGVGDDHLWQAVSDDRGLTWHGLKDTGVKGHPPDLLRLQDGRLLLTYGFRHDPTGIRAVVSADNGETWDLDHVWTLRDDGGGFDLGYPHSVQLRDGTVVTVYYFVRPGGMQYIACSRWRVPR